MHRTTPRQHAASHQLPPFSTPAQSSSRARATPYEPLSDSIETSPISSDLPRDSARGGIPLNESIEVDSESPSSSREDAERPSKRRRFSSSPVVDATPDEDQQQESMIVDEDSMIIDDTPLSDGPQGPYRSDELRTDSDEPHSPVTVPIRHPMFLSAPRFKPSEVAEAAESRPPLPDAFSPQRRGAKYVAGGLAAELRDWLVQVKGASEYDRPEGDSVRFNVNQVRTCHPGGMCIISGTEAEGQDKDNGMQVCKGDEEEQPTRVILAGEGRIAGLRGRNSVTRGQKLSLFQPMWDIDLEDLGHFAVACDWDGEG